MYKDRVLFRESNKLSRIGALLQSVEVQKRSSFLQIFQRSIKALAGVQKKILLNDLMECQIRRCFAGETHSPFHVRVSQKEGS